jgi:hypothetical protein
VDRTALLSRWSELAPEECATSRSGTNLILSPFQTFCLNPELTLTDKAVLLLALIEAVEKRGWWLTLESGYRQEAGYTVTVGSGHENFLAQEHPEPCDALLQAYVSALEASRG